MENGLERNIDPANAQMLPEAVSEGAKQIGHLSPESQQAYNPELIAGYMEQFVSGQERLFREQSKTNQLLADLLRETQGKATQATQIDTVKAIHQVREEIANMENAA